MRIGLVIACLLAGLFAARLIDAGLNWEERSNPDIAGWMTLGFIANGWDADRAALEAALGLRLEPGERLTLDEVAARSGRSVAEVTADIEAELRRAETGEARP